MTAIAFDTHAYVKKLRAVGFSEEQAEVQAQALADIIDERLATKQDLSQLQKEIKELEERLVYRLTIRMGGMVLSVVGLLIAFKLL